VVGGGPQCAHLQGASIHFAVILDTFLSRKIFISLLCSVCWWLGCDGIFEVTISPEHIILQREKKHCTIFICAQFMWAWGLQLGLRQS